MKLNLGCGSKKLDGFVNIDIQPAFHPDRLLDLEIFPWPFEDHSVGEVNMEHILEHIGAAPDTHRQIMQELYRISRHGTRLRIVFPHPRSDTFLIDPTHVRPITVATLNLYSRQKCREFVSSGAATTPLAIYWGIDFEIRQGNTRLYPYWHEKYERGELTRAELEFAINAYSNVVTEVEVVMEAIKV